MRAGTASDVGLLIGTNADEFVPKGLLAAFKESERGPHTPDEVA